MPLQDHIRSIQEGVRSGQFNNEAAVSQGIVLRLLNALGWPTYDTRVVWPEYSLEGRRVDYALCHPPGQPAAFIEVKQLGQSQGAERQLFEYAFHVGIPMGVLTDGQEWNFFLPGEQGSYGERRVYKLDLIERDLDAVEARLRRYLEYDRVTSGQAIEQARNDYRDAARSREIEATLPKAWTRLIQDEDDQLLELIADRVEDLCGFKPDPDAVAAFLKRHHENGAADPGPRPVPFGSPAAPPGRVDSPVEQGFKQIGFRLNGQDFPARNACDVLVKVFEELGRRDPTFLERFASLPQHGRTRRYLARTPEELYPGRPDLARDHFAQLSSGWYVGTNVSRASIGRIIRMACDVAGIRFGDELIIELGR